MGINYLRTDSSDYTAGELINQAAKLTCIENTVNNKGSRK